ncbi:MAG: glycine cleavage system aminomethyltransferase GcvT [Solirubrobacteraceae bacterium]|nr:glycine cleavage system aminomethyltransferase GcvT [Solirubrobacteraceae bacterium]
MEQTSLKRTSLFDRHRAAGAKLVPFAGWEMPVQYEGIRAEHEAVRTDAGVFDVSHMGEIETRGDQALEFLQRILSNDVSKIPVGGAQYALLTREDGGVIDDLFTYRLAPDHYLTVTNASNHDKDLAWFVEQARAFDGVTVRDSAADYAMLAVQGPRAREVVQAISDQPLPARMTIAERRLKGQIALVAGTGYTGEDGVELLVNPDDAPGIWDELLKRGAKPVGLAARDTLRSEVCFHLYGNDLMEERDPITAGLGWAVKEDTGFIGADTIAQIRANGPAEKLVSFKLTDKGIARQGNAILKDGEEVGVVTTGTLSPSLDIGIGMGYVRPDVATPGTALEIDVRGKTRPAVVATKPLYPDEESDG